MHKDALTSLSIIRLILAYKDEDGFNSHTVCVFFFFHLLHFGILSTSCSEGSQTTSIQFVLRMSQCVQDDLRYGRNYF